AQPVRQSPTELRSWHTYVWWMSEAAPVYCGAAKRPYGPEDALSDPRIHWTVGPNDEFLAVARLRSRQAIWDFAYAQRDNWLGNVSWSAIRAVAAGSASCPSPSNTATCPCPPSLSSARPPSPSPRWPDRRRS